jgi:thiamine transporter ThiT
MKTFLFGNAKSKAEIVTRIAIMLALTLLVQWLTGLAGIQLLTGSFVNMFIFITTLLCGLIGGITVGLITPFIGYWLGFAAAPSIAVVPIIGIANALLAAVFALLTKLFKTWESKDILYIVFTVIAVVAAAGVKFLFMYFIGAKLVLPYLLTIGNIKQPQMEKLLEAWGFLQLFTALIGGGVATALSIPLRKLSIFSASE